MSKSNSSKINTTREIDVAVWTAEQIMQQYSDPYDAIEWLVLNLKDEAFNECAEYYDERMNALINQTNKKYNES